MSQVRLLSIDVAQTPENKGVSKESSTSDLASSQSFSDVIDEHYQEQQSGNDTRKNGKNISASENKSSITSAATGQSDHAMVDGKNSTSENSERQLDETLAEQVDDSSAPETFAEDIAPPLFSVNSVVQNNTIASQATTSAGQKTLDAQTLDTQASMAIKQVGDQPNVADNDAEDLLTMLGAAKKILTVSNGADKVTPGASEQVAQKNAIAPKFNLDGEEILADNDLVMANKTTRSATIPADAADKQTGTALSQTGKTLGSVASTEHRTDSSLANKNTAASNSDVAQPQKNAQRVNAPAITNGETTAEADEHETTKTELLSAQATAQKTHTSSRNELTTESVPSTSTKPSTSATSSKAQEFTVATTPLTEEITSATDEITLAQNNVSKSADNTATTAQGSNENKLSSVLSASTNEKPIESTSKTGESIVNNAINANANGNDSSAAKASDSAALNRQQTNTTSIPTTVNVPIQQATSTQELNKLANETNADNVDDIQVIAKDGQHLEREKVASMVNQTLDLQASRTNAASMNEPSTQQVQTFDSMMNRISNETVQTQKTVTTLQNETISIYRKDFAEAVKDKVMVMINQKIQQVDIQLDPPEMGNVHVRVNLQNEQAAVQFVVQNQQAKDALDQNINKLKEMLAESGVDVGEANIEHRQSQENEQQNMASGQQQSGNEEDGLMTQPENQVVNMVKASSTGVDYYA